MISRAWKDAMLRVLADRRLELESKWGSACVDAVQRWLRGEGSPEVRKWLEPLATATQEGEDLNSITWSRAAWADHVETFPNYIPLLVYLAYLARPKDNPLSVQLRGITSYDHRLTLGGRWWGEDDKLPFRVYRLDSDGQTFTVQGAYADFYAMWDLYIGMDTWGR